MAAPHRYTLSPPDSEEKFTGARIFRCDLELGETQFFFPDYPSLLVDGRQTYKRKISREMCELALW